jgi:hypothetical protein
VGAARHLRQPKPTGSFLDQVLSPASIADRSCTAGPKEYNYIAWRPISALGDIPSNDPKLAFDFLEAND